MFFNSSYSLDDNDQECVEEYGIHAQYNWAAYRCEDNHADACMSAHHADLVHLLQGLMILLEGACMR